MEEALLREISEKYLLPFFSGATIELSSTPSKTSARAVAILSPQIIGFKVNKADKYRLRFRRDQPFAQKTDPARETLLIESFVGILGTMEEQLSGPLKDDLLSTFQRRVVARAAADDGGERQLLSVIDQMAQWATNLYEGAPIVSAIGIDPTATGSEELPLEKFSQDDFAAVLSNGFDTLLIFDPALNFSSHSVLPPNGAALESCPWRHAAIANWTKTESGRVAVVLNRLGEILVFRDGLLLFARRGGKWHFLTHGPVLNQMGVPKNKSIRRAIYETVLDASFARTGACLGVVRANSGRKWEHAVAELDRLNGGASRKALSIARIVSNRKFQDLERTLRQELVAIDGATIIDHKGNVLAVGAIISLPAGSTGGGRTAAAKELAKLGLGVKVSQDGRISAYRPSSMPQTPELAFELM
ncbi:MAG: hypothetical protein H6883_02555 [Rhodobiaceae bacterium]|nr:hypothetical protein [Rhodobiaceae bacterium]MCC0054999.1 hypothetical protein [Rhodobiaceae bacterium]